MLKVSERWLNYFYQFCFIKVAKIETSAVGVNFDTTDFGRLWSQFEDLRLIREQTGWRMVFRPLNPGKKLKKKFFFLVKTFDI